MYPIKVKRSEYVVVETEAPLQASHPEGIEDEA
jgi:hypothetical protein